MRNLGQQETECWDTRCFCRCFEETSAFRRASVPLRHPDVVGGAFPSLCFSSPLYAHFFLCFPFLGGLTYRHFGAETRYVELESVEESTRRQDWFASRRKPRQCQNKLDIRAVKFLSPVFFFLSAFFFSPVEYFFSPPTFFDARVGGVGVFHFKSVLAAAFFFLWEGLRSHVMLFFPALLCLFFSEYIPSVCLMQCDGALKLRRHFLAAFFFSFVNIRVPAHFLAKNAKTKKSNHQSYHRRSSARLSTSALYQFSILFCFLR